MAGHVLMVHQHSFTLKLLTTIIAMITTAMASMAINSCCSAMHMLT